MSDPLNQVEVSPETLQFTESRDTTQRFIKISNFSNVKIAYRIRVSVQHIFVVPHNEGFVNGNEEVDIVVTMKPLSLFPDADLSRIKFAVEIAPVEPGKDGNIKEFLATNSNSLVRRSVLCYVTRVDLAAQEAEARRQEEQVLADTEEQAHYVQQSRPFQSQQQDIEPIQQIPAIPIQQGLLSEQDLGGNDNEYAEEEEEFPQHQYQHYQPQQRQHRSEDHGMAGEEQHFDGRSNSSPNTELQKISSDTASRNENVAFSISALSDQMDSAPTEEENAHNGGGGGSGGNRFPMSLPDDRGDQHFEPQGDARPSRPRPSASGSAVGMNSHQGSLQGMSQGPTPVAAANQANVVNHQVSGPRGRVLELMVKNVSRDAPLTKSEVAELQEIRGVLSKDDWQEWLVVARKEKYRRQDEAAATLLAEREKEEAAEREREREKERERAKRAADVSMVGDNSFYDSMHNTSIHAHQGYQPGGYQGQGQGQNHHYPLGQGGFTPQPQSQFESVRGQYNSRLSAPSYQAPVSVNSSSAPDTSPRPAPPLSQLTMDQIPSTPTSRSRANSRAGTPTHRDSRAGEVAYSTAASSSTTFNIPREFQRDFQKQMEPNEARSAASASPFRQRPTGFTAGSSYNNSAHTHYTSTSSNGVNSNANGSFLSQRSASPQMLSPQKSVPHGIQAPGAGFPKSHPFGTVSNFVVDNRLHQQSSGPSNVTQRVHGSPTKPDQMHMHMHMQSQSVVVAPGSPTKYSQPQREELSRANTMTRAAVPTQFGRPQPQPQFYQPQADTLSMSAGLSRARYGAPPPPPPEEFEPEPYYPRGSSVVSGTVSATGGAPVLPMSAPAMPLQPPTASVSRRRGPLGSSNNGFMPQQQNQSPNLQQHSATAPVSWDNGKDNWTQSTQYQVHRAPQSPSAYGATMIEREPDYLSNCDPAPRFSSTANAPSSRTQPSSSTSLVPDLQPQSTPAYLNMMATGVQTVTVNPVDGIVTPCYTDMNYNTSNKAFNQSYNQSRGPPSSDMYFANDGNEDPADLDMQRAALNATAMSQRLRSSGGVQQMQSQQNYRQHSQGQNQPVYVQPYQQYVGPQMTSDIHTAYAALPVDDTRFDNSNTSYIKHVVPMQNQNQMHSRASPAPSPVRSRPMSASSNSYVDSDRGNGMSVSSQSQQQSRFSQSQNLRGGNVSGAATVPKFLSANAAGSSHNNVGRIVTPVLRSTTPNRHNNQSVNRGIVSRNNMSNSSNLPFTFEGVKYDKAQDRLARVCLAQGPLVKAFEEFPIRIDMENLCCDVVWREYKHNNAGANNIITQSIHSATTINTLSPTKNGARNSTTHSVHNTNQNIQTSNAASVLRRERFNFDDIYAGPGAFHRLTIYTRLRIRQTLLYKKPSLVLLCVGCGEDATLYNKYHQYDSNASSIEPPVAMILGDSGGAGLISAAIDEIFTSLPNLNDKENDRIANLQRKTVSARLKTRGNSNPSVKASLVDKNKSGAPYVTMQAVVLLGDDPLNAIPLDLLSSNVTVSVGQQCWVQQQPVETYDPLTNTNTRSFKSIINNTQSIHLKKPSDFERIVGVMLGRRTSMHEHVQALMAQKRAEINNRSGHSPPQEIRNSDDNEVLLEHLADSPWLVPNNTGTLMITVTVHNNRPVYNSASTYRGSGQEGPKTEFHFVSPCGKQWSTPASDICMLVEAMSCVPHPPPHTLYRNSLLAQLLVHPEAHQSSDYVLLTTVNRRYSEQHSDRNNSSNSNTMVKYNPVELSGVIQSSLQSLRLVAQLSGIY